RADVQGAPEGGPDTVDAVDRALPPDAEALGTPREIRRRVVDADPRALVLYGPRSRFRDDLLVRLVVAVRPIVEHHGQQRQPVVGRRVQRAHDVEEITIGLQVHADLAGLAMSQGDAQSGGQAVATAGARAGRSRQRSVPAASPRAGGPSPWRCRWRAPSPRP